MRTADGLPVRMAVAVYEQFLGAEPVVDLDPLEAATIDPEVIGLFLNLSLRGLVSGR